MDFTLISVLLVGYLVILCQSQDQYPCAGTQGLVCSGGQVCRLVELDCAQRPCTVQARCVDPPLAVSDCRVGDPVVDTNNTVISCYTGRPCPLNTICNTEVMDTQTTCCWPHQPFGPPSPPPPPQIPNGPMLKPGTCPANIARNCINVCAFDDSCHGDQKCCNNGCGRSCQQPENIPEVKPGTCPSAVGQIGICAEMCSGDGSCPGTRKCCSNGCGHTCQEPSETAVTLNPITTHLPVATNYAIDDPCRQQTCPRGSVCRLQEVRCIIPPCYPQPTCVPDNGHQPNACSAGFPVLNINRLQMQCRQTYHCPEGTACTQGSCCWNEGRSNRGSQGTCPVITYTHTILLRYCHYIYQPCRTDDDCFNRPTTKCCWASPRCGHRCMVPEY